MAMVLESHFQGKPLPKAVCVDVTMPVVMVIVSESIRLRFLSQFSATEMNEVALRETIYITEFTSSGFW